jgi:putative tryptophan/tyrosine transport system substrate-binding protein
MKRRTLLAGFGAALVVRNAAGQRIPRIGVITIGVGAASAYLEQFRQGLLEHGYIEGKGIYIEYRFAQGRVDALPGMIAELVRLNVNLIVTEGTPTALAAQAGTKTIPIVMATGTNPVLAGLASSLARPGGNVTGLTLAGANRTAKQLQLLKESLPALERVAVLYNPSRPAMEYELKEADSTARSLALVLRFFEVRGPDALANAFQGITSLSPGAMITIADGMLLGNSGRIADFALRARLPAAFPEQEFAEAGGLMAYGPDIGYNFRRAAGYVARILKGAKPADLPIEQPTKWGLVVNLRTAKTLGLKIPGSVLVRADALIDR